MDTLRLHPYLFFGGQLPRSNGIRNGEEFEDRIKPI